MPTSYESDIILGQKYKDKDTGLVGTAISLHFYKNACERVLIQYLHDGDIKEASFDAVDLIHAESGVAAKVTKTGGPARSMPSRR